MNPPAQTPVSMFPAILIAGMPHCGKSVLAYMLSQHLRRMDIAHYLLRAAPDGEGDWFLEGEPAYVRTLRRRAKGTFTAEFITHMKNTVENRLIPLLVDVGGLPRDEQFGIIRACTHAILLYKEPEGSAYWEAILKEHDIPLIARLQSVQNAPGSIARLTPCLEGTISGLDRRNPQADVTFGALLDRIAGLFRYQDAYLEQIHLRRSPYPPISERALMKAIRPGFRGARSPRWQPADLPPALQRISPGRPAALYGRGPVWLAAAVAARVSPAPMSIYDARYGWLPLPQVAFRSAGNTLQVALTSRPEFDLAEIRIAGGILEPESVSIPPFAGERGLVLSGKLPRWAYAALAHALRGQRSWIAIHLPRPREGVVVASQTPHISVGDTFTIP